MKLYFDGGCRPNPGTREVAVFSEDRTIQLHEYVGYGTNNEAEWIALLWAMEIAKKQGLKSVTIIGDSELIINQATGKYKVKQESFKPYHTEFLLMKNYFSDLKLEYIPRKFNLAGQYIEMKQK